MTWDCVGYNVVVSCLTSLDPEPEPSISSSSPSSSSLSILSAGLALALECWDPSSMFIKSGRGPLSGTQTNILNI